MAMVLHAIGLAGIFFLTVAAGDALPHERAGQDLYPLLDDAIRKGRIPATDLVRPELYKRLGFYPTESSEPAWWMSLGRMFEGRKP